VTKTHWFSRARKMGLVLMAMCAVTLLACGGAKGITKARSGADKVKAAKGDKLGSDLTYGDYGKKCRERLLGHRMKLAEKRYIPPMLRILHWANDPNQRGKRLAEEELVDMLVQGHVASAMVEARGGLGKSTLAKAIEAQTCSELPVFTVDVARRWTGAGADEPITRKAFEEFVSMTSASWGEQWSAHDLSTRNWLLIVDALDELSLDRRSELSTAIKDLKVTYKGHLRLLVLVRPPVFAGTYGLEQPDVRLVIERLDCDRTRERVQKLTGSESRAAAFWALAARTGLDRENDEYGRCIFPHMATYRDINVVIDVLKLAAKRQSEGAEVRLPQDSRLSVYHDHIIGLLMDVIAKMPDGDTDKLLAFMDTWVALRYPLSSTRSIALSRATCLKAAKPYGDPDTLCKALVASRLIEANAGDADWRFKNQSIADYFLGRWAAGKLKGDKGPECARVTEIGALFESNEVAGFMAGLASGRACLWEITREMCERGCSIADTMDLLEQGIVTGAGRCEGLAQRDVKDPDPADGCANAVFEALCPKKAP
jgi:hypothetical protein